MKPLVSIILLTQFLPAQQREPRAGAAATSRGDTLAWVSSGIRRARGPLPGDPISGPRAVTGAWSVGGGSGTQSHGQADFNADTAGLGFEFDAGGKYKVQYAATLIMGAFVSATKVLESGQWTVRDGRLVLEPASYDGWISVMSGPKQPVVKKQVQARTFEATEIRGGIVIRGKCFEYQVDPYCSSGDVKHVLDFPLRRSSR